MKFAVTIASVGALCVSTAQAASGKGRGKGKFTVNTVEQLEAAALLHCEGSWVGPKIKDWNVEAITNFDGLFANYGDCNPDVGKWNVMQATSFQEMFANASAFNRDLSQWEVAVSANTTNMFVGACPMNATLIGGLLVNASGTVTDRCGCDGELGFNTTLDCVSCYDVGMFKNNATGLCTPPCPAGTAWSFSEEECLCTAEFQTWSAEEETCVCKAGAFGFSECRECPEDTEGKDSVEAGFGSVEDRCQCNDSDERIDSESSECERKCPRDMRVKDSSDSADSSSTSSSASSESSDEYIFNTCECRDDDKWVVDGECERICPKGAELIESASASASASSDSSSLDSSEEREMLVMERCQCEKADEEIVYGKCQKITCADDEEIVDRKCQKITCADDEEIVDRKCQKITCADDEEIVDRKCQKITCADDEEIVDRKCQKITCADDEKLVDGKCKKIKCARNEKIVDGKCQKIERADCKAFQVVRKGGCVCASGAYGNSEECTKCPANMKAISTAAGNGAIAKKCVCKNEDLTVIGGKCACNKAFQVIRKGRCVCASGAYGDSEKCRKCPANMKAVSRNAGNGSMEKKCACKKNNREVVDGKCVKKTN